MRMTEDITRWTARELSRILNQAIYGAQKTQEDNE